MLNPVQIFLVREMLDAGGLSQRQIARAAGVSRGSVASIAAGKRHEPPAASVDEWSVAEDEGPPVRCQGCGGLVYVPCRLCRARNWRAERSRHFLKDASDRRNDRWRVETAANTPADR